MDPKITEYNQIEPLRIFVFQTIGIGNIAQLKFHTVHGENCSYGSYEREFGSPFFSHLMFIVFKFHEYEIGRQKS